VPFVPSVVLSTLNDDYRAAKARFDFASAGLPANVARDSAEYLSASFAYDETMQKLLVLLLSKRVALYFLATAATAYAGWRASMGVAAIRDGSVGGPGDALDRLNREVLEGESFLAIDSSSSRSTGGEGSKTDEEGDDDDSDLFATLVDRNPQSSNAGNVLALALPLVLAASLGISYLAIALSGAPGDGERPPTVLPEAIASSLPYLTSLPSAALCLLFAAAEFRWALPERSTSDDSTTTTTADDSSSSKLLRAGNVLALAYVAGAYLAKVHPTLSLGVTKLDLWPLQNGVNIALATAVSRALSPFFLPTPSPSSSSGADRSSSSSSSSARKSIRTVALALVGLALFDAVFTFGTVANAASSAVESSMSVMETVARSRLADSSSSSGGVVSPLAYLWQPGLLEIVLGHDNSRATEALGVGDVVFPSILVAWAFAADDDVDADVADGDAFDDGDIGAPPSESGGYPYATSSVVGYVVGSLATEIVGSFRLLGDVSGLPALVFLVPSMLSAVTVMAWSRNELGEVWGAPPGDDDDGGGSGAAGE